MNQPFCNAKSTRSSRWPDRNALLGLLLLGCVTSASAHTGEGTVGGLISGFFHPITGFDHLLAMVAVGIWGATLGRPLVWALPVAFPLLMVVGGILGITGVQLPYVESGIALSVVVLGLAIAVAWLLRWPSWPRLAFFTATRTVRSCPRRPRLQAMSRVLY